MSVAQWVSTAWSAIPQEMIARSSTASGLMPLQEAQWCDLLHSRLKTVLCPDEPVVLYNSSDEDDVLEMEENPALYSDAESDEGSGG